MCILSAEEEALKGEQVRSNGQLGSVQGLWHAAYILLLYLILEIQERHLDCSDNQVFQCMFTINLKYFLLLYRYIDLSIDFYLMGTFSIMTAKDFSKLHRIRMPAKYCKYR